MSVRGLDAIGGALLERLGRAGLFIWSGWTGVAALALLAAIWRLGHEAYGDFILSDPLATFREVLRLLGDGDALALAVDTTLRAVTGFAMVAVFAGGLGIAAGYSPATMRLMRPVLTVVLGVPAIAWIVLAMIWFGSGDATVRLVVVVATAPVVFIGAAEGIATRDRGLDVMAQAFGAGPFRRFLTLGWRQAATTLWPGLTLALGIAFKVAVMAELLANAGGIGGALAQARSDLDITRALAWVLIAVAALIAIEYALVQPVRAEFERWRRATQPWGVKW